METYDQYIWMETHFRIAKEFLFEKYSELWQAPIILFMDNLKGMNFTHYFPSVFRVLIYS